MICGSSGIDGRGAALAVLAIGEPVLIETLDFGQREGRGRNRRTNGVFSKENPPILGDGG